MRTTTLLAVFCAALLISCEPVSEPDLNVPDPSFGKGPVLQSATGSGNIKLDVGWRLFSFSAWEYAGGTVQGQFRWNFTDSPNRGGGIVTCMTIDGNQAWLGGMITEHASDPSYIGLEAGFRVVDNGEGANADADLITRVAPVDGIPDVPDAQTYCDEMIVYPDLEEVESGNVRVRG